MGWTILHDLITIYVSLFLNGFISFVVFLVSVSRYIFCNISVFVSMGSATYKSLGGGAQVTTDKYTVYNRDVTMN